MTTKLSETLMPPDEFEATMLYFVVRQGNSRDIAHAYHVLGMPASTIASQYGCSKQNVVKVLARFATAYERYNLGKRNAAASAQRAAVKVASNDASPRSATKKVGAAKKASAKPAAKKPARKTVR
ncbi:hypothetical protein [Variovorax sp. GT1P44]|uniref:hypothetical protein n=1 Tax=Variovorax sp. GT1P44 TaxID=3443742 RepID=UPI003F461460